MQTALRYPLVPVARQSLSDAVFDQLTQQIMTGDLSAGEALPAERVLCEALGVNRGCVREALRRLEQARLVSVRHGGTSRVLDFRETAGLDLLPTLLLDRQSGFDADVVRGVMEMRSAIAPDAARWAARRRTEAACSDLDARVEDLAACGSDLSARQGVAMQFWTWVIVASGNIAYRLAYNSLRETYSRCQSLLTGVLQDELLDTPSYAAIAAAVRDRNEAEAENRSRVLVRLGEEGVNRALAAMVRMEAKESVA